MAVKKAAILIPIDSDTWRGQTKPPSQLIPESEKNPTWYFKNLEYVLTFYNQPAGQINFPNALNSTNEINNARRPGDIPNSQKFYPVQFMIKMMQYYLGMQPNLNYNWLVQDVTSNNMQPLWIKGNDVSEFVNYFRGLILGRISNANFTAKPLSKDATNKKTDLLNQLMFKFDMKPFMDQMKALGINFDPAQTPDFEAPEEVQKWVDVNFKEAGSLVATDLANGLWFSNHWLHKTLQAFMHTTITGTCAMEHYVSNGRNLQNVLMPYQLVWDNRIDDDYGRQDQFIGAIRNLVPHDIFAKWPEFNAEQRDDIEKMCRDTELGAPFNSSKNINWWVYNVQSQRNTVTCATVYWRGRNLLGKKKAVNKYKTPKIVDTAVLEEIDPKYAFNDIYKATLIGNKYLVDFDLLDNVVEEFGDKSKPLFPIIRFMPNTFMGQSISEVARVHKIQDELDMYDFQIRTMIGRSKGKVYFINANKFDEATTPKEFWENVNSMGIHIQRPSGEANDATNSQRTVEMIDWTLDPNIDKLSALYREKKERMSKILSASPIAMGQQTKYIGLGTQQGTIAQNNLGSSYLIDGFMEWIVMNMRYAVNQAKNIYTIEDNQEASFVVGDRGVAWLKFTKGMRFEDYLIELNINDSIDEGQKKAVQSFAQAWSQNPEFGVSPLDILKLYNADSMTEAEMELKASLEKGLRDKKKMQAEQAKAGAASEKQQVDLKVFVEQLRQDNENYRTLVKAEVEALTKSVDILHQPPPPSPLQQTIAAAGQPQQPIQQ